MGLVKEPLNIDFYFENRQMTDEDQKHVSDFIANQKRSQQRHMPLKNKINKTVPNTRRKKIELDVDFIGDPDHPLTEKEAKAISEYIKAQKAKKNKAHSTPEKRVTKGGKSLA